VVIELNKKMTRKITEVGSTVDRKDCASIMVKALYTLIRSLFNQWLENFKLDGTKLNPGLVPITVKKAHEKLSVTIKMINQHGHEYNVVSYVSRGEVADMAKSASHSYFIPLIRFYDQLY
jgi:ABC-type sulfate transport system substrate-binding protein